MLRGIQLLSACALALAVASCATTPPRTKMAVSFHHPDYVVNFPGNGGASVLRNIAVTVDQDANDPNRTIWALAFDVQNQNQDKEYSFQGSLNVYFLTADNAPVPNPGKGIFGVFGWRDHCYYGGESHRYYQGRFDMPYADFIRIADHIRVESLYHGSKIGGC